MHFSRILIVISKMRLKLSKNLSKVFQYMWIPLSDIFFFKKLGDPCQFQSLKFWKFYNVKTWFLTIFKCHFEALRVFFWKNVRKQTPPKMANFGGVYFLTFFRKTNRFGARRRFLKVHNQEMLNMLMSTFCSDIQCSFALWMSEIICN